VSWLYTTPLWLVALAVLALVLAALETGHRLGRVAPVDQRLLAAVSAPILATVGFLLAFALGMAGDRHDARRAAAVKETNAIGTFWLRTSLLDEPARSDVRALVRRYVDVHIEHRTAGIERQRMLALEAEASRIQQDVWNRVGAEVHGGLEPVRAHLLVTALNTMIDEASAMIAAKENRVPDALLVYLFLLVVVAGVVIGYRPNGERRSYVMWALYLLVLAGLLVIMLDIDRPRRGFIKADTSIFMRLEKSLIEDSARG
jgi:hypothetical protein